MIYIYHIAEKTIIFPGGLYGIVVKAYTYSAGGLEFRSWLFDISDLEKT